MELCDSTVNEFAAIVKIYKCFHISTIKNLSVIIKNKQTKRTSTWQYMCSTCNLSSDFKDKFEKLTLKIQPKCLSIESS